MRAGAGLLDVLLVLTPMGTAAAQAPAAIARPQDPDGGATLPEKLLQWQMVGPQRGGRAAAVAGHADQPLTYYFGACGGGVWKTSDGGQHWRNVSDGFFGGSIGAIAVAPSDANVLYVGGGEVTVRGNWSHGDGMWRSTDAGKSWQSIGLMDSRCIPRIRVHPRDENLVYAAVLGHLFGPHETRGVYRSKNGGKNWERVLYVDENVGACDLLLDPSNPRIVWASTWRVRRTPSALESGGPGSGLWKSVDGGDTWSNVSAKPGLPQGTIGIIGVAVAPTNSARVWAIVEADEGGVFRSDDGGEHWARLNDERELRQRAWYYSRIYADPLDQNVVYVVNVSFWRSEDGGKTFQSLRVPHGDNHDLWIAPDDSRRMIEANDGGATVSFDRGANWSTLDNQPTAQFYRVSVDNSVPWRIYGAQQDNSALRLYPFGGSFAYGGENWEITAGGESGHLAPDPRNPDIVYGGSYGGFLDRLDHRTRESRNVMVWPDNPIGWGAAELKYRFQWNYPLFFSRHEPGVLFAAANVLFKSSDDGQSWTPISPDLTRNDKSKMAASGGPITKDNTSVEYYGTIFAATDSAKEPGVIWCGSDDGLLFLTRDGGKNWSDVTPRFIPEWIQINSIEPHPSEPGGLYVAATMYKHDDNRPYLYRTLDYGKSWTLLTNGIDEGHFTRVIRADPVRAGLIYAGTEGGLYVSFDDGGHWLTLQHNLPIVPITDLAVKDDTLIAATQGRAFWILDELHLLRQLNPEVVRPTGQFVQLMTPKPVRPTHAQAVVDFYLQEKPKEGEKVALKFLDAAGQVVRQFVHPAGENEEDLQFDTGFNRVTWNGAYSDAKGFPGMILWGGELSGPRALPGNYSVVLAVGSQEQKAVFAIEDDPRLNLPLDEQQERFEFLLSCRDLLTRTHESITKIRDVRAQLENLNSRCEKKPEFADVVAKDKELRERLTAIEEALYQTKMKSSQDPLNYPIRLNNKLAALASAVASNPRRPTEQAKAFRAEVGAAIDAELGKLTELLDKELPALNRLAHEKQVPAVFLQGT